MAMDLIHSKFKALFQELTDSEINEFFETYFLAPTLTQLDAGEIPAEEIRQQRKQIKKIKNFFLTLRNN